jgi:hypothetical protein
MAAMKRVPSARRFVVRGAAEGRVPKALLTRAVRRLPGEPGGLVVDTGEDAADPRAAWEALARLIGPGGLVAPVLVDERGHELYPTGRVQVRFQAEPSEAEIGAFATRHHLASGQRNRYQALQCAFAVEGDYLPDVVARIAQDPAVKRAWEDVEAAFERS